MCAELTNDQAFLLSETLTVLVVCLAKCSTVSLILRVFTADTERGKRWVTCWVFLGLSVAWGIGSILGLAISCDINTILTVDNVNQCKNQVYGTPNLFQNSSWHHF